MSEFILTGGDYSVYPSRGTLIWKIGKYRGYHLKNIPRDYFEWIAQQTWEGSPWPRLAETWLSSLEAELLYLRIELDEGFTLLSESSKQKETTWEVQ